MTDVEHSLHIVRAHVDAFNTGDREAFLATLAHDAVLAFHSSQRVLRGPGSIVEAFWSSPDTVGGVEWEVVSMLDSPPYVTVEYVRTYQSSRVLRRVSVPECAVYTIRDGRIATIRHYSDRMTELVQLGALAMGTVPEPSTSGVVIETREVNPATSRALRRLMLRRDRHTALPS